MSTHQEPSVAQEQRRLGLCIRELGRGKKAIDCNGPLYEVKNAAGVRVAVVCGRCRHVDPVVDTHPIVIGDAP